MPFLDEIAARLVSQGVGALHTSILISSAAKIPTGAGPYLSLRETGGMEPTKTQNDTGTQRPSAQLLSRALNYISARTQIKAAYDALGGVNGLYNVTLSGTFYISLKALQEPTDLGGLDGAGRVMLAFNVAAEKYPS